MPDSPPASPPSPADKVLTPEEPTSTAPPVEVRQIPTPEKPPQPRERRCSDALFVDEVRRTALEIRRDWKFPVEGDGYSGECQPGAGASRRLGIAKIKADGVQLPEKYEMHCEFFNCMESTIRLLRLKGSMTTFTNICYGVQHLSGRRFTYSHLAKLKYVLPEAIMVKQILVRDEKTCCMMQDLQVTILVDAIESNQKHHGEIGYSVLRRTFRQRLVDFITDHPEADDIPDHELPHPFNQTKSIVISPAVVAKPTAEIPSDVPSEQQPVVVSHMSHSFRRRFSQKSSTGTSSIRSTNPLENNDYDVPLHMQRTFVHDPAMSDISGLNYEAPGKLAQMPKKDGSDIVSECGMPDGTPIKYVSTPVRLMVATPEVHTSKLPASTENKRLVRTKLFATPTKDKWSSDEDQYTRMPAFGDNDDSLSFLPYSLLKSVKQKEKRALEEKEAGFTDRRKRQKVAARLPGTFDTIFLIYQSRQHSVMTKHELIHKIIASNLKIVDKGEVELQLKLLQELIPEWIYEKTALSGDILCCINTALSQTEIRQKLRTIG